MSTFKRITVICFAAMILAANLPLCASAVDPVSAATMANALAQAITAYGASQGVSMTFNVTDTDGIGEGVHELWDQFVTDVNDSNTPTYNSLAVTMWSNLYSKIGNNLGINISASEMPFIDSFWNWLLSGPAEMTKVDNQYFEWSINQDNTVSPITVMQNSQYSYGGYTCYPYDTHLYFDNAIRYDNVYYTLNYTTPILIPCYLSDMINFRVLIYDSVNRFSVITNKTVVGTDQVVSSNLRYSSSYIDNRVPGYYFLNDPDTGGTFSGVVNQYSYEDILASFIGSNPTLESSSNDLNVRPYIGNATPQNVYIPDNTDVNYNPTDVAIPLDIPWDNTLFGDGNGVLTDAQSEAAAAAADDAITDSLEKTLTIADTDNPDIPAPGEVYVPFLPVTLPNFNFNLSGIWHYVREWITSLGAWFSTVLTVWAYLPYAMVVPVYAALVIVIVLGVYKRFFM